MLICSDWIIAFSYEDNGSVHSAFTVLHRSLDTPVLDPSNKKVSLKNNGLVSAQKPSNVKSD
jgi:hypothetical protein